jgi:hypothetical protein
VGSLYSRRESNGATLASPHIYTIFPSRQSWQEISNASYPNVHIGIADIWFVAHVCFRVSNMALGHFPVLVRTEPSLTWGVTVKRRDIFVFCAAIVLAVTAANGLRLSAQDQPGFAGNKVIPPVKVDLTGVANKQPLPISTKCLPVTWSRSTCTWG